jgi:hypothetical protein
VVGATRNIYVREADAELWARAEEFARRRRMPMSGLVMAALEWYLTERPVAERDRHLRAHDDDPR